MRRFSFRLETLLRHRETIEDLRNQEFSLAQGRHDCAMRELEAMKAHYDLTVADRPTTDSAGQFDAPAIQSRERYLEALQHQMSQQQERVEVARMIAEEMRIQMVAAKQDREAVTRLREKDYEEYVAESHRKSQDALDEIASVAFQRRIKKLEGSSW